MTKAGFGDHLRREREMRGVSLDEICAATRIGNRFLEALESEEWERLPGGVFNRGFVRAVARFLGLDEEAFVAEYLLATSEQPLTAERPRQDMAPPPAIHWQRWAGVLLGLALIAAGAWGWRSYAIRRAERRAPAAPSLSADPTGAEIPSPSGASSSVDDPGITTSAQSDGQQATSAALTLDGKLQLKIEAGKGTSLTVSADGNRVFDGSMIAGQSREFAAQEAFKVQAQDAGALLLELNGQMLAPVGPPGRSGEVTLTRSDLKTDGGPH
jgi:cytoskeleton protein RodZ